MREITKSATVFELLNNYVVYGDEVILNGGEITLIIAGKKNSTVTDSRSKQC